MDLPDQVIAWLAAQAGDAYLVGGSVRDRLLGRLLYDLDVATDQDGLALARRLADQFQGNYYPLDFARGTGRAIVHGKEGRRLVVDVAHFRGPDLAADLADRDFTINAMAAGVRSPGSVIDLHGGLGDLAAGLIRPVADTSVRADPVRALRAIRLAAQLDFKLTPEAEALIRRDGPALREIAGERVRDELARLLGLRAAATYLCQLDDIGLLTIILPELESLRKLEQPPPHYLNALAHSLQTLRELETLLAEMPGGGEGAQGRQTPGPAAAGMADALSPFGERVHAHLAQVMSDARPRLLILKLAALLHDTGKPSARTEGGQGRVRFLGHQERGARLCGEALRRLRFSGPEIRLGETIVRHHMRPLLLAQQEDVSARAVYRFFRDTGAAGVDVLLHALADHRATYAPGSDDTRWPRLVALTVRMLSDYWDRQVERVQPPLLIGGHDLLRELDLQPGPQIGELLEAVREAQVSGEVRSRDEALALVRARLVGEDSGLPAEERGCQFV